MDSLEVWEKLLNLEIYNLLSECSYWVRGRWQCSSTRTNRCVGGNKAKGEFVRRISESYLIVKESQSPLNWIRIMLKWSWALSALFIWQIHSCTRWRSFWKKSSVVSETNNYAKSWTLDCSIHNFKWLKTYGRTSWIHTWFSNDKQIFTDEESSGHSLAYVTQYKTYAERFFQLFISRYSSPQVTTYMIKYIDHVPELRTSLSFKLFRFKTAAGEHRNYNLTRLYYSHTTRYRGRDRKNPIRSMKSLYRIVFYSANVYI